MTPEIARQRAAFAVRLEQDEAFNLVMQECRERQLSVFLSQGASDEDVLEAHRMIGALNQIEGQIARMKTDAKRLDKREDQHRGN